MKQATLTVFLMLLLGTAAFAVQVFFVDFGNVNQGQSKSIPVNFNANDIDMTIAGDTPFEVQVPAPFTVSPATGTVRRLINTTVTVTLPANASIGVFDLKMKIILHKSKDDPFISFPLKAAVVGFAFTLTPATALDLGSQSQGSFLVKNNSVSTESFRLDSRSFSVSTTAIQQVNPGGTIPVTVSVPAALATQAQINDTIVITDQRSSQTRTIQVTATPANAKPDLLPTIVAVKVFPRSAGETETDIQVTFNVKNIGFANSSLCQGKIFLDNDNEVDLTIDPISIGATAPNQTTAFKTTRTGPRTVKVRVDTNSKNNELDENNNQAIKDIDIPL